jgi:hypothetical protein
MTRGRRSGEEISDGDGAELSVDLAISPPAESERDAVRRRPEAIENDSRAQAVCAGGDPCDTRIIGMVA